MKILNIDYFEDGGRICLETDEGHFFKYYGMFSDTKCYWFEGSYIDGKPITCPDRIKQLERLSNEKLNEIQQRTT